MTISHTVWPQHRLVFIFPLPHAASSFPSCLRASLVCVSRAEPGYALSLTQSKMTCCYQLNCRENWCEGLFRDDASDSWALWAQRPLPEKQCSTSILWTKESAAQREMPNPANQTFSLLHICLSSSILSSLTLTIFTLHCQLGMTV